VNYGNSLVVTITVTCNLWAPSSGDHLFTCGAIYLPLQQLGYSLNLNPKFFEKVHEKHSTNGVISTSY